MRHGPRQQQQIATSNLESSILRFQPALAGAAVDQQMIVRLQAPHLVAGRLWVEAHGQGIAA